MYLPFNASRIRQREAQNARNNRAEIVKALADGQITKRDLLRWGIYTAGGLLVAKNGLSPYARSAFASDATGVPRSPLNGVQKFSQELHRLQYQAPIPMTALPAGGVTHAVFQGLNEPAVKRLSYHTDFTATRTLSAVDQNPFRNPVTNRGPMEGRPPGEMFAHQRWNEFFPKKGYIFSLAQCRQDSDGGSTYFHDMLAKQGPDSVWCYGSGPNARGSMAPPLLKLRYGEPVATRIYNRLPTDKKTNGGFGRNESQLHFHNAHNGAESDGAANVHHFPGTFYDYRWSTTLARRDTINTGATDPRASGPDDGYGLVQVAGDFRELQGSLWAHDHRVFFTAENVYKGNLMGINMYSGPDRGYEGILDGGPTTTANKVNLRLPSGTQLKWGNTDFDVNLIISDGATDAAGQYFFDIFTTDGFIGDMPLVNFEYAPVMKVLPRKYRLRLLNASMSRFIKLLILDSSNKPVPFQMIANDGNLLVRPLSMSVLDEQGTAERYDIVVDFKGRTGPFHLVNILQQTDGRKPDKTVSISEALSGKNVDPMVGAIMRFELVSELRSVDNPSVMLKATDPDPSLVPNRLTDQIPIVTNPVRTRVVEFGRGNGDSRSGGGKGACIPDCSEVVQDFPWIIKVNGQAAHSMNANRISMLIPKPGEVEHWTYINGGGGWDHPIHLHFEEGITMNRGDDSIPESERLVRKDVWRLRPSGQVTFQVQFGEYGGSYVNHCHNTVHEDFAMLMRIQVLGGLDAQRTAITPTPNPTEDGVFYTTPEILPEADPKNAKFFGPKSGGGGATGVQAPTSTSTAPVQSSGGGGGRGGRSG